MPPSAFVWGFVTQPSVLAVLAVSLLAAWPVGRWLAARYRSPLLAAVLFAAAVGLVLAITGTKGPQLAVTVHPEGLRHAVDENLRGETVWREVTSPGATAEEVANVLLYVPVGFLGALVRRHAWRAALFGIGLTVAMETWQSVIGRDGDIGDVLHNGAGAVLGAIAAGALLAARRPGFRRRRPQDVRT